jgi:hypothetical protein
VIDAYGALMKKLLAWKNLSRKKTCPRANFSTTNSTWTVMGLNPCFFIEKQESNCLRHGMVITL